MELIRRIFFQEQDKKYEFQDRPSCVLVLVVFAYMIEEIDVVL